MDVGQSATSAQYTTGILIHIQNAKLMNIIEAKRMFGNEYPIFIPCGNGIDWYRAVDDAELERLLNYIFGVRPSLVQTADWKTEGF